jgi:CDP-glucose 4,6-dehydratase
MRLARFCKVLKGEFTPRIVVGFTKTLCLKVIKTNFLQRGSFEVRQLGDKINDMHYLITGHTGFKGSWLALLLKSQGHKVSGISLDPINKSLFMQAKLFEIFCNDIRLDIRKSTQLLKTVNEVKPDVLIHLAAQPLVRESYKTPLETFEINVMGTLNILKSTQNLPSLQAVLIITSDKVYKNHNRHVRHREGDELGGDDPYSASKAAADIATQSWITSFAKLPIAIARAGNVIGGGDWSRDRIVPDMVDSFNEGKSIELRFPQSLRPWQHVLDCLSGYMKLIDFQIKSGKGGIWNFGPSTTTRYTVQELADTFAKKWGRNASVTLNSRNLDPFLHESSYLQLDSEKARRELSWDNQLDFQETIQWTVDWYKQINSVDARTLCINQINNFLSLTR